MRAGTRPIAPGRGRTRPRTEGPSGPPRMPLIPAMRPLASSSKAAEAPIKAPPASGGRNVIMARLRPTELGRLPKGTVAGAGSRLGRPHGCPSRRAVEDQDVLDRGEERTEARIAQAVEHHLVLPPCGHDLGVAQLPELLRQRRLADAEALLDLRDRTLLLGEQVKDAQSVRVGDQLEQIGGRPGQRLVGSGGHHALSKR